MNPHAVFQTNRSRSQSQTAVALMRIDDLSEVEIPGSEYFGQLLEILIDLAAASSGHIWQLNNGDFVPMVRLVPPHEDDRQLVETQRSLAEVAFNSGSASFHEIDPAMGSHHPTQRICMLVPLFDHAKCFAVVSLIHYVQDTADAEARLANLGLAANRVRKNFLFQHFARLADQLPILRKAQQVSDGIGKYIEIKPLSFEVVSRLREYLDCDRVSLAFKHGKKCVLKAVSNQSIFDKRANVVRRLEQLSAKVAGIEEPLWYPNDSELLAPSLRASIDSYFEASNALSIALLPLFGEPRRRDDPEDIAATIQSDEERRECIGVLILEGFQEPLQQNKIRRRWDRVESSVSNSIANARMHENLFLMPLWRSLGVFADFYRGHTRRKALLITAIVAALLAALILIPGDFKLRGEGTIRPTQQQHVYAETDGTIDRLLFKDGQVVEQGDLLIAMENPQLATRIATVEGKLREAEKTLETTTVQRVSRAFDNEQEERELVRAAAAEEVRIAGLREQLALLKRTEAQLNVRSPIAGDVVTWDTRQRLSARPVSRGERLLTIASGSGGWEIELRIPDKRAGYLLRQWQQTQSRQEDMAVSFVLASDPTKVYEGTVFEIAPKSNIDDKENENVVRVRIRLTDEEFARIDGVKPGTTVIAMSIAVGLPSVTVSCTSFLIGHAGCGSSLFPDAATLAQSGANREQPTSNVWRKTCTSW